MTTRPDCSATEHIKGYVEWIQGLGVPVTLETLRYFDERFAQRDGMRWVIPRSAVGGVSELARRLEELFTEGRDWINLCGLRDQSGGILIGLEYSAAVGRAVTHVNHAGPPHVPPGAGGVDVQIV